MPSARRAARRRTRPTPGRGNRRGNIAAMDTINRIFGTDLPIIQAPMAGVQAGALAAAVSEAGGLGSLPCALLGPDALRKELDLVASRSRKPVNVNFFCHVPPTPDPAREAAWREALGPYFRELGIDAGSI